MRGLALLCLCPLFLAGADQWRLQYFHDQDEEGLSFVDLKFLTPLRGIAVGFLTGDRGPKPVALLTSDGGKTWMREALKEPPVSLFFLNESLGWMVTSRGLWSTEEGGRSWRKGKAPERILRVHFLTPERGFAVGARRRILHTRDGGRRWEKLSLAEELKTSEENTTFTAIDFADPKTGLIAGNSQGRRRQPQDHPDWVDPEAAVLRRQLPGVAILIETRDGGEKWTPASASVFGRVSRARLSPEGWGLALLEYDDFFEHPSDVLFLNWKNGQNVSAYKEKGRRVTDLGLGGPKGPVYLAAIDTTGKLTAALVPGRVRMIRSLNATRWEDQNVDYRAVARRVVLSVLDAQHAWAATDTGMILRLEKER